MLLNIKFFFYKYLQVLVDIKQICGYLHIGYPQAEICVRIRNIYLSKE